MLTLEPRPPTRLIRSDAALSAVIPELLAAEAVSVDTEFHSERSYHPRLMLLQLRADDGEIFLVDPLSDLDLRPLGEVVEKVPLLVHGGQVDVQILRRVTGVAPRQVFDTQVAAGCAGQGYPRRLQELVKRNLGEEMDKSETLSDWSRRPLNPDQMRYAADDVWVLPALVRALRQELLRFGNAAIARAAMAEHLAGALEEAPERLWRSVPGVQSLDGDGRAALQALCVWRDRMAQERDLNRSAVVSDGLLLDLARRRPRSVELMQMNRRMPSQVIRRDGAAILAVLSIPRDPLGPVVERPPGWTDLLRAWGRVAELERGVAMELTLPESVLGRISQGKDLEDWRLEALGSSFLEFVRGHASLVMPPIWTPSIPTKNFDL